MYYSYKQVIRKRYRLLQIKRQRQQLKQIKNINDSIRFLKSFCQNITCVDNILNKIYILYLYEPPSDIEIQTLSILQQKYQNTFNIEEYTITTLWCCVIYYIENLPNLQNLQNLPNLPKVKRYHSW